MSTTWFDPTVDKDRGNTGATPARDVARALLRRLAAAWDAGDGDAFARPYADGATFVTIRGELHEGRHAIASGHGAIFATIYAGSTNRMELVHARHVAHDVIVLVARCTLDAPHGPLAGVHTAASTSVLVSTAGRWQVATTHNTLEATA